MRTIKYRGINKNTNEWVFGFYVKHETHTLAPIRTEEEKPEYQHLILKSGFSDWLMPKPIDMFEVFEESVGQFTGLTDKNGVEIFEGDILKDINGSVEVWWNEGLAQFWVRSLNDEYYDSLFTWRENEMDDEVIGNVFSNPELLKEGAE